MLLLSPEDRVVILTGAGVSAESGIKTFRDCDGLWEKHNIEDVATPEGFSRNPRLVWKFYNERRTQLYKVKPNLAHTALVELEKMLGDSFFLITQNVDNLHERAGTQRLVHMHGELLKIRCTGCDRVFHIETKQPDLPRCSECQALLRPHIVWFGEIPFHMDCIHLTLKKCSLFIAIGTSGQVHPASQFIQIAKSFGARTLVINPDPDTYKAYTKDIDYFIAKPAGDALSELVQEYSESFAAKIC